MTYFQSKAKHYRLIIFGILNFIISLVLFYLIFLNIDLKKFLNLMNSINVNLILLCVLLSITQVLLNCMRWFALANQVSRGINFIFLFKHTYMVCFLGQVLPSSIGGEAYKIIASRVITSSLKKSIIITLVEKYIVLMSLIFLILVSFYCFNSILIYWVSSLMNFFLLAGLFLMLIIFLLYNLKRINIGKKFVRKIKIIFYRSTNFIWNKKLLIYIMLISFLSHINLLLIFKLIASSIQIQLDFFEMSYIFFIIFLFSQLPISFGGWGVREATAVTGLALLGVSPDEAFTISTLFGLLFLVSYSPAILFGYKNFEFLYFKLVNKKKN